VSEGERGNGPTIQRLHIAFTMADGGVPAPFPSLFPSPPHVLAQHTALRVATSGAVWAKGETPPSAYMCIGPLASDRVGCVVNATGLTPTPTIRPNPVRFPLHARSGDAPGGEFKGAIGIDLGCANDRTPVFHSLALSRVSHRALCF
jgi:hypothetical protein